MTHPFHFKKSFVLFFILTSFFAIDVFNEAKAQVPDNNECINAIPIEINSGWIETTNIGSTTGPSMSCGAGTLPRDVWFSFVYTGGAISIITQLGTLSDTRISVRSSCTSGEIACNDDFPGLGFASQINLSCGVLNVGETYYVQAAGFSVESGTFSIRVDGIGVSGCTNLTASNFDSCAITDDGSCIFGPLQAAFNFTPGSNCELLDMNFASRSTGNVASYLWSFPGGNPSTSTAIYPQVNYPNPGIYTASLTVTSVDGLQSTQSQNFSVSPRRSLELYIFSDNPEETSWKLFNQQGEEVAGAAISGFGDNYFQVCLESDQCHTFVIYDSAGDGICCSNELFGEYYLFIDGDLIAQGGDFEFSEATEVNCPPIYVCNNDNSFGPGIGSPCLVNGQIGNYNSDCVCTLPLEAPCRFFMSNYNNNGGSDIYEFSLDEAGLTANLWLIHTTPHRVSMALNPVNGMLYLIRETGDGWQTINTFNSPITILPEISQPNSIGTVTGAAFDDFGLLFIATQQPKRIWTATFSPLVVSNYAQAPVTGGDIVFNQQGELNLASRSPQRVYTINQNGPNTILGPAPANVSGIARTAANTYLLSVQGSDELIVGGSNGNDTGTRYQLLLNGVPFTASDGDMASRCIFQQLSPNSSAINELENSAATGNLYSIPNPTEGISTVVYQPSAAGRARLEVYDVQGRSVATIFDQMVDVQQVYSYQFDGSTLPNGVYLYRLTTDTEVKVEKFMIAR